MGEQSLYFPSSSCPYYHQNTSREEAELLLRERQCPDGLFLVRDSEADHVLSLCYGGGVLHYRVARVQTTGEVVLRGLPDQIFASMEALLVSTDSLATRPRLGLDKASVAHRALLIKSNHPSVLNSLPAREQRGSSTNSANVQKKANRPGPQLRSAAQATRQWLFGRSVPRVSAIFELGRCRPSRREAPQDQISSQSQVSSLYFRSLNVEMPNQQVYGPLRVNLNNATYGRSSLSGPPPVTHAPPPPRLQPQQQHHCNQIYSPLPVHQHPPPPPSMTATLGRPGARVGPESQHHHHHHAIDLSASPFTSATLGRPGRGRPESHPATDLFASPPPHLLYDTSVATLCRVAAAGRLPVPKRRVSFADQLNPVDVLPVPFATNGLIKSSSVETLSSFTEAEALRIYSQFVPSTPPVPLPRKKVLSTYANQETIALHQRKVVAANVQNGLNIMNGLTFEQLVYEVFPNQLVPFANNKGDSSKLYSSESISRVVQVEPPPAPEWLNSFSTPKSVLNCSKPASNPSGISHSIKVGSVSVPPNSSSSLEHDREPSTQPTVDPKAPSSGDEEVVGSASLNRSNAASRGSDSGAEATQPNDEDKQVLELVVEPFFAKEDSSRSEAGKESAKERAEESLCETSQGPTNCSNGGGGGGGGGASSRRAPLSSPLFTLKLEAQEELLLLELQRSTEALDTLESLIDLLTNETFADERGPGEDSNCGLNGSKNNSGAVQLRTFALSKIVETPSPASIVYLERLMADNRSLLSSMVQKTEASEQFEGNGSQITCSSSSEESCEAKNSSGSTDATVEAKAQGHQVEEEARAEPTLDSQPIEGPPEQLGLDIQGHHEHSNHMDSAEAPVSTVELLKEFDVMGSAVDARGALEEDISTLVDLSNGPEHFETIEASRQLSERPSSVQKQRSVDSNCSKANIDPSEETRADNCDERTATEAADSVEARSSKCPESEDDAEEEKEDEETKDNCGRSRGRDSNGSDEYEAIKFDKETLDRKASLGLATLEDDGDEIQLNELDLICLEENEEEVRRTVSMYRKGPIALDPRYVTLRNRLGNGYFGEVYLASLPSSNSAACVQVAVKLLKTNSVPNHKNEILKEAQAMASLDHKHIVRLIGVCEGDAQFPFMLVLELAPLGPLHTYLQEEGESMSTDDILILMLQVSMAMQYLESRQFIHRDLAARNILLVNERFAKVSDFGMSRALGLGKEYYKARVASKWPLKWYAPECIYFFKFSSKSDVWSYGVTLWEALSYGQRPYEGMDGQDILRLFRENRRLARPANCPDEIYKILWSCWLFRPEDRPSFADICQSLTSYLLCSTR